MACMNRSRLAETCKYWDRAYPRVVHEPHITTYRRTDATSIHRLRARVSYQYLPADCVLVMQSRLSNVYLNLLNGKQNKYTLAGGC